MAIEIKTIPVLHGEAAAGQLTLEQIVARLRG